MGSIAGVLIKSGEPDARVVRQMLAASPHRGSRIELVSLGDCFLGASTSTTIPDAGIAKADGLVAAFEGLLDNLTELVELFPALARSTEAVTPAQVVLEAFRTHGDDAPSLFRGVFAGIVSDGTRLWCFRDQFAFAPLFFRDDQRAFFCATEPKQIVAGSGIPREPDLDVLERLMFGPLAWGELDDETPAALKGVRRIPKATVVSVDGGVRGRRYWDPSALIESARYSPTEIRERFESLMARGVSRVQSGNDLISLSGGVDSPAVAAFASRDGTHSRLAALSQVYPDYPSVDEGPYIRIAADHFHIPLHTYTPTARPLDDIEEWVRVCDGPVTVLAAAQTAEHYSRARELGYGTVLTGEQAEVIFDQRWDLLSHLLLHGKFALLARQIRDQRAKGYSARNTAKQVGSAFVPTNLMRLYQRHRRLPTTPSWIDAKRVNQTMSYGVLPARERWRRIQLGLASGPAVSFEADDVCQAVLGVRHRRGWADVDLLEFFISLPAEVKFPRWGGKAFVRSLLRGKVPDAILDRQDRTRFDDYFMSRIDYPKFARYLVNPKHRIPSIRYDALAASVERRDFTPDEYKWALDLVKIHVFLEQW